MANGFVDAKAGQIYSESGANVVNNDNKGVFSFISTLFRQLVSMLPWVSQFKREKDSVSQAVSLGEALSQAVSDKDSIRQIVTIEEIL